jgi:hypothetical protein
MDEWPNPGSLYIKKKYVPLLRMDNLGDVILFISIFRPRDTADGKVI